MLKRLAVIQSLLTLHETEDLPKHLDRLEAEPLADSCLAAGHGVLLPCWPSATACGRTWSS